MEEAKKRKTTTTTTKNLGPEPPVKKKKKYLKPNVPSSVNALRGRSAIMCTCSGRDERKALGEAVDLVEAYVDKLYPREEKEEVVTLSIRERLKQEAAALRSEQRVVPQDLETQGVLYLTIEDPDVDVVKLAKTIVDDVASGTPGSRLLIRMMPLATVCYASLEEIRDAAKPLVARVFSDEKKSSYKVAIKRRNNSDFPRQEAIETLAALVPEPHPVDLENPDVTILVEVFKSIAGVSVVPGYAAHHDFNLRRIKECAIKTKSTPTPDDDDAAA
ncbi:hypothetical protein CTAYLR_003032 [Chrysophaeum taylorii]|uniref:THUMP domain-containing protein n=1 Tax=Chrysophaeum taylorii TaxID=2483200 RepID=A0AAD7XEM4_9STRA|nr:hypothetical protein CTAYLR_003032 [Chrysophaeum taylorii]